MGTTLKRLLTFERWHWATTQQDNDKTMTGDGEGNYQGMGHTQPEVSPNTAVGTKGSLGTAEKNTVRKYSTVIDQDAPTPQNAGTCIMVVQY